MKASLLSIINSVLLIVYIIIDPYMEDTGRLLFAAYAAVAIAYALITLSSGTHNKEKKINKLINKGKQCNEQIERIKRNQRCIDALAEDQTDEELIHTIRSVVTAHLERENERLQDNIASVERDLDSH